MLQTNAAWRLSLAPCRTRADSSKTITVTTARYQAVNLIQLSYGAGVATIAASALASDIHWFSGSLAASSSHDRSTSDNEIERRLPWQVLTRNKSPGPLDGSKETGSGRKRSQVSPNSMLIPHSELEVEVSAKKRSDSGAHPLKSLVTCNVYVSLSAPETQPVAGHGVGPTSKTCASTTVLETP